MLNQGFRANLVDMVPNGRVWAEAQRKSFGTNLFDMVPNA